MRCSVLPPQLNFTRKATVCLHPFIPICADRATVGMVIRMDIQKNPLILWQYLTDRKVRFLVHARLGLYNSISDKEYLEKKFQIEMDRPLHLDSPITFNEKLQWLKLYDRRPEYTMMVDKYLVRQYIADKIGPEYLIPLFGVWNNPDEIDFGTLPPQFVLKCNHNSGLGMCICKDRSKLDIRHTKINLQKGMKQNYYLTSREWPYKNVPRKIIAEKYMTDSKEVDSLTDYKFFCFDGIVDNVMIVKERETGAPKFYHFDKDWKLCRYNRLCRSLPKNFTMDKPPLIDKMFVLAKRLSEGIPHVRVDLYVSEGQVYFGEMTFFHQGGYETGFDSETDIHLGSLIKVV